MIQAIGLTSMSRRRRPPAVDDLTFEARPGKVTVLLGSSDAGSGAGTSDALRLMLQLLPGRGVALFRGRPMHRVPHPAREVGVLLGDVPGHPARTARGHLRMLTAVAGVPARRADDVLDVVGLSGLADQRLGDFSLGMDRRLGIASALLGDPHTLVLDDPARGLSPREASWLHGLLRGYADQGGLVLTTSHDPKEAARIADRVVSVEDGRLVADQDAADFRRTRLRPRVAVRTPHAERLAAVLAQEARAEAAEQKKARPVEVVRDGSGRVSVYGSSCAAVGESAYRNGILIHQLAEEIGDSGDAYPPRPLVRADGRGAARPALSQAQPSAGERGAGEFSSATLPQPSESRELRESHGLSEFSGAGESSGVSGASGVVEASEAPTVPVPALTPVPASAATASSAVTGPQAVVRSSHGVASSYSSASSHSAPTSSSSSSSSSAIAIRAGAAAAVAPGSRADAVAQGRDVVARSLSPVVPRPGPAAPLRYEFRRVFGVRTPWVVMAMALLGAVAVGAVLVRAGVGSDGGSGGDGGGLATGVRLLVGWPPGSPFFVPPAAVAAGLLGAFAFGQEFRYPALAPAQAPVPRRLGMLLAKLFVSALTAVVLCLTTAVLNAAVLTLLFGADSGAFALPSGTGRSFSPLVQAVAVLAVCVGCAWAGLLAAGVFRSTWAGTAAVVAVPLLVAPAVRKLLDGPAARSLEGLPERLQRAILVPWPSAVDQWVTVAVRLASQPLGRALALSLTVLLCAYALTSLRSRPR
ncbi:ATP-binding cassette domain-containing protein [Streptomyces sp. NPDC048172]|uniref:ATP-binding cassette domain-containing protein n=1 Tax=Streptomyces sp. NPDC048172 TaxID=3365505 RepID=UPI0037145683